jgi:hypothetical protein
VSIVLIDANKAYMEYACRFFLVGVITIVSRAMAHGLHGIWGRAHLDSYRPASRHSGGSSVVPRFLWLDWCSEVRASIWIYIRTKQSMPSLQLPRAQDKTRHCFVTDHHASTYLQTCRKAPHRGRSLCGNWEEAHDHTSVIRLEGSIECQQSAHRRGASHLGYSRVILSRAYAP